MNTYTKKIVNRLGVTMIGLYESETHNWIKWLPQESQHPGIFVFPWGKFKGKTLREIYDADSKYFKWMMANCSYPNVVRRMEEFIAMEKS
jgi:hypothetical protein